MSKPISISFGKSRGPSTAVTINGGQVRKPVSVAKKPAKPALTHDSEDEDERGPVYEEVLGFAADGAIVGRPAKQKDAFVIKNAGNGDWRTRGRKSLLPDEVRAQREEEAKGKVELVEKNEVSKASGLQYAERSTEPVTTNRNTNGNHTALPEPAKEMTEDEAALHALLNDGNEERMTNAVIIQHANARPTGIDETDDFKADVASRPDVPTLDEYAAMPVEEFGLAMLRGMGQKRRANGDIVNYGTSNSANKIPKISEPRQGYLGLGAKAAPGAEIELGAWGKADMRKNKKGEGLYTPVLLQDKRTGEMITEQELEERKKEKKQKKQGEEDWRDRRDRNLEQRGRNSSNGEQKYITDKDDYRDQMNGFSRSSSSRTDHYGYKSSRSARERSQSQERPSKDHDDKHRDGRRDKSRDDHQYDSSSSRRSNHRHTDRDRDRDLDHQRRDR